MPEPGSFAGPAPDVQRQIAALGPDQRARFEQLLRSKLQRQPTIRAVDRDGPWPASFGQERMWLGTDIAPAVNNYATAVRLRGRLSLPTLRAAVLRVVARHEALRTTLRLVGDRLVQDVGRAVRVPFRLVDLAGVAGAAGGPRGGLPPEVRRLVRAESRRPFDLARGPLLRVAVFRLGLQDHCVLLTIHHTATDGWSNGLLVEE